MTCVLRRLRITGPPLTSVAGPPSAAMQRWADHGALGVSAEVATGGGHPPAQLPARQLSGPAAADQPRDREQHDDEDQQDSGGSEAAGDVVRLGIRHELKASSGSDIMGPLAGLKLR